jgi:dihydroorotase-like cyclic amidohydrolase
MPLEKLVYLLSAAPALIFRALSGKEPSVGSDADLVLSAPPSKASQK